MVSIKLRYMIIALMVAASTIAVNFQMSTAATVDPIWSSEPYMVEENQSSRIEQCQNKSIWVAPISSNIYEDEYVTACVYYADGYSYAKYERKYWLPGSQQYTEYGYAYSTDTERYYYNPDISRGETEPLYSAGRDSFVRIIRNGAFFNIWVYDSLADHISVQDDMMRIDSSPDHIVHHFDGSLLYGEGFGISNNGNWLSFVSPRTGVYLLNIDTHELRLVDAVFASLHHSGSFTQPSTAVSGDGKYVFTTGAALATRVYKTFGCTPSAVLSSNASDCMITDLSNFVSSRSNTSGNAGLHYFNDIHTDDVGSYFSYFDQTAYHRVYAKNMRPKADIKYLALGDSFASGEGDLQYGSVDNYIAGTNVFGNYRLGIPRELCHQSVRSYPYLLAAAMKLSSSDMKSVACSGAITFDIVTTENTNPGFGSSVYKGQSTLLDGGDNAYGPRLSTIPNALALQDDSRTKFLPGRVQQIEFVRKTRPEVVTIMVGGNDMDFGGILSKCVLSIDMDFGSRCKYTTNEGKQELASKIFAQYPKLVDTYSAVKAAGGSYTKVYVIGYPDLFSTSVSCAPMLNSLSQVEREVLSSSVKYANSIIASAAKTSGAAYIDISKSLGDSNKLCGSNSYLTDIGQVSLAKISTTLIKNKKALALSTVLPLPILDFSSRLRPEGMSYVKDYASLLVWNNINEMSNSVYEMMYTAQQEFVHPNSYAHQAMYSSIIANFNEGNMSECQDSILISCNLSVLSTPPPDSSEFINGTSTVAREFYDSFGNSVKVAVASEDGLRVSKSTLNKGHTMTVSFDSAELKAAVYGNVSAALYSDPIQLGDFRLQNGVYTLDFDLPANITLGLHTLYATYKDINGAVHNLTKDVFVDGPLNDLDDDQVLDINDKCLYGDNTENCDLLSAEMPQITPPIDVDIVNERAEDVKSPTINMQKRDIAHDDISGQNVDRFTGETDEAYIAPNIPASPDVLNEVADDTGSPLSAAVLGTFIVISSLAIGAFYVIRSKAPHS